jgi:hypothetical protein
MGDNEQASTEQLFRTRDGWANVEEMFPDGARFEVTDAPNSNSA